MSEALDDMIGRTFKNGRITITGVTVLKGRPNQYTYTCRECAKDPELYGDGTFSSTKHKILYRSIPCGCGVVRRTTEQYRILINRLLDGKPYTFLGFVDNTTEVGHKTRLNLYCEKHDLEWSTIDYNKLSTRGCNCPECTRELKKAAKLETPLEIEKIANSNNKGRPPIKVLRRLPRDKRSGLRLEYECSECSYDAYVRGGVCSGVFTINAFSCKSGKRSCRCSPCFRWNKKQRELQIRKKLKDVGGTFVSWVESEVFDSHTKFKCLCKEGHPYTVSIDNFTRLGLRCSECAKTGFSFDDEANLYITRWWGFGESYLKTGVTNGDVSYREHKQFLQNHMDKENLYCIHFSKGSYAFEAEQLVKAKVGKRACSPEYMPCGWTETNYDTKINLDKILTVICESILESKEEVYE